MMPVTLRERLALYVAREVRRARRIRRRLRLSCRLLGHRRAMVLADGAPSYSYCERCGDVRLY